MSTLIEISCAEYESLLEKYPQLTETDVCWGSETLSRLLFPEIHLDYYDGVEGGILGLLKEQHGLACSLLRLSDEAEIIEDPRIILNEIERLLAHLASRSEALPPNYLLESADGSRFETLSDGSGAIECGFDHCVMTSGNDELISDLRDQHEVKFRKSWGRIVRTESGSELETYLQSIKRIAQIAAAHGCQLVLRCE